MTGDHRTTTALLHSRNVGVFWESCNNQSLVGYFYLQLAAECLCERDEMSDFAARRVQFEQCVHQHHAGLYRVAFRLTRRQAVALELVQETYLQAWQGLDSLREPAQMRAWLFGILRRQYLKLARRRSERLATDLAQDGPSAQEPATNGWLAGLGATRSSDGDCERRDLVQWALGQLEEKYRFPVLLQLMEDLSVDEIGRVLELPQGTVLSQLHRGKQKLREILQRQTGD